MGYPHDYPRLSNEQDFERLCLRLFRRHLQLDDLQLYGRRGQKQDGCDLVGVDGQGRVVGIQCKQREVHRPLTQEEVRAEVEKAKGFHPPLARYIIATSAPRDTKLQQLATQLTRSHRVEDLFHVTVMCWDDLQELLRDYPEVATHFYGITTDATDSNTTLPSVMKDESSRSDRCGGDEPSDLHAEIDEAAQHLTNRQPKIAVLLLHRLMKRQRHRLTSRCLYRVHANLGHCHIRMNEPETAASEYLKAKQQQPKDPEARRLEAHAYLLRAEREKARTLLSKLLQDEPEDARARALWIHSLPRDTPVADAEQAVPEAQRSSSEVALALATLAAARGAWREAEQKARTAVEHDPQWHEAKIQLAEVLLNRAQDVMDGVRARDSSSPTPTVQAREVVDLLTGVLSELENVAPASDLAPVWCSLAAAQWLLGKRTEMDRYLEKAVAEA
ncbi:MAG: hypothetical protein ACOC9P_02385, partial [bacterium]